MYETSYEYLEGLKNLSEAVNKISNCKLVIKFRSTYEINKETIQNYIGNKKNVICFIVGCIFYKTEQIF